MKKICEIISVLLILFSLSLMSVAFAADKIAILALGDSLTAGTQDATTFFQTQKNSWIVRLSNQIQRSRKTHFIYPALMANGSRIGRNEYPTNFAIPGLELADIIHETNEISLFEGHSVPVQSFISPIGSDLTPLEAMENMIDKTKNQNMNPWIFLWVGANDAFFDFTSESKITEDIIEERTTDPNEFEKNYDEILSRIINKNPGRIFVITIPNLLKSGFLFTQDDLRFYFGENANAPKLKKGDLVPFNVVAKFLIAKKEGVTLRALFSELAEEDIVDVSEQRLLKNRIEEYNNIIREVAKDYQIEVIEASETIDSVLSKGTKVNGAKITRSWGRGGMFSLDGIHPSNTGHALIANAFIKEINELTSLNIPELNVSIVYKDDPYRDSDGDGFVKGPSWNAPKGSIAELLRLFVDQKD